MVAFSKIAVAALVGVAAAHPGEAHDSHHMKREITARDNNARHGARSLATCGKSASAQALKARSIQRRADQVKSLRRKRGIQTSPRSDKRDLASLEAWEAINHNQTGTYNYDMFTPLTEVFDANTSCILAPEVTDGPYYVVGEYMRSNVVESENSEGVSLFLEVQYIDVNTCEPIPDVAVDIWNANATGVYAGVVASGNGNSDDEANINTTFLRGIQLTDNDGVVAFETIFPGHYSGRAVHTHLLSHTNATIEPNGTISVYDAPVSHIGQLFWPESLRADVETTYPYTENTVELTTNDEDMWSIVQTDESYDPIPEFLYLGESIADGLFAWIQIGINGSADYTEDEYYGIAGYFDAEGGHSTGYTVGPSSGGDSGNGTAPSGVPTGAAPTASA